MFDTQITVVGNLVADPRLYETASQPMASFRVASTPRRLDRTNGEWRDGETLFASVTCWRGLAENVALSLKKGQSVIVFGRLMKRSYETKAGEKRESVDIEAYAVGPDLARVAAVVKRWERTPGVPATAPVSAPNADSPSLDDADFETIDADIADVEADRDELESLGEPILAGSTGRLKGRFGIG